MRVAGRVGAVRFPEFSENLPDILCWRVAKAMIRINESGRIIRQETQFAIEAAVVAINAVAETGVRTGRAHYMAEILTEMVKDIEDIAATYAHSKAEPC